MLKLKWLLRNTQVQRMGVKPGTPIGPMLTQRLSVQSDVQSNGSIPTEDKYSCTDQGEAQ